MDYLKKYFTMTVSVILLLVTVLVAPLGQNDVRVGKGEGENAKVETIDELNSVLDFVSNSDFQNVEGETYSLATSEEGTEGKVTENKHSSATFHTESISKISHSHNGPTSVSESYIQSTSMNMDKSMSVYMTKEASYYRSIGTMNFFQSRYDAKKRETIKETYYIVFDVELFFEKDSVLLKYNEWTTTGDAPVVFTGEFLGKWFQFEDPDIVEVLGGADLFNREVLGQIGSYLDENKDSHFAKNDGVYSLKEDYLLSVLGSMFGLNFSEDSNGELTVDLSHPEKPSIVLSFDYSNEGSSQDGSVPTVSTYAYDNIRFENIDNTEIRGLARNVKVETVTDPEAFVTKYIVEDED